MDSSVMPAGIFVVFIMTSPDWGSSVLLCSSHVSVNKAPRGHDYSMSLHPLSASISLPLFPFPLLSIYSRNWWFNEELGHHEWPPPPPSLFRHLFLPFSGEIWFQQIVKKKKNQNKTLYYLLTFALIVAAVQRGGWSVKPECYQRQTGGSLEELLLHLQRVLKLKFPRLSYPRHLINERQCNFHAEKIVISSAKMFYNVGLDLTRLLVRAMFLPPRACCLKLSGW